MSVIIPGARGKRKNKKISLYHNLALLDLEVYYKASRDLQQIREARPVLPMAGLTSDPIKSTMALFLSEIFYRTLKEEEANPELFSFLENALRYFELAEEGIANFHLYMLIHLTRFLGFFPDGKQDEDDAWFNIRKDPLTKFPIEGPVRLDQSTSDLLVTFLASNLEETIEIKINRDQRNNLLETLLDYYRTHMPEMGIVRSHAVLKEIFD